MGYVNGLLEGFRARGDEIYNQAIKDDADRRQREGALFTHLLQSRDPEIRALALQGIYEGASPSPRKKGWRGFLGEIQTSSVYPQIKSLAEQLVPDEPPSPPGSPQSAAMSTNVPVQQPSTPMQITAGPTGQETITNATMAPRLEDVMPSMQLEAVGQRMSAAAQQPQPEAPEIPAPPPPPQLGPQGQVPTGYRKRGTQVPTAEEILEYQSRIPTQTRIGMAQQHLNEEDAKRAIMGILGAPQSARQFSTPTFAVIDPINNQPVPVAFDSTSGGFFFTDGTRVPRGAKFVRMSGGSATGSLSSFIRDTPESRRQLIARGADPAIVNAGSTSGFFEYRTDLAGNITVNPSEFTPPPDFSGTIPTYDPQGVVVRSGVNRTGGGTRALGDEPRTDPPQVQQQAKGLLATVDAIIARDLARGPGGTGKRVPQGAMDQLVRIEAKKLNLPYQTYGELQQAAGVTPNITPREERDDPNAGMSYADRIRKRALEEQKARGPREPVATPAPPLQRPSARSQGPGPRK